MTTIREILATENPSLIHRWQGSSYDNIKWKKNNCDAVPFDDIQNSTIQDWEDFTYNAIELAYGDIFGLELQGYVKPNIISSNSPRTIKEEENLDSFWEQCKLLESLFSTDRIPGSPGLKAMVSKITRLPLGNLNVIRGSLKTAALILRARSQVAAQQAAKAPDVSLAKKGLTWKNYKTGIEYKPGRVVFEKKLFKTYQEEDPTDIKEFAYIVGDSKLTEKWKSEYLSITKKEASKVPAPPSWKDVEDSDDDKPKPLFEAGHCNVATERILPLQQLATNCQFAETRYCFLVTQVEVVVFRIRRIDEKELVSQDTTDDKRQHAAFEYRSISWNASGKTCLNFNLAVWALACMGMNDHHREMEGPGNTPLDGMARLTHWVEDNIKGEYTNAISGRVIRKENWAKMKTDFVRITTDDDYSKTRDFYRTGSGSSLT